MDMYSKDYLDRHIGKGLSVNKFDYDFKLVESYFKNKCISVGIESSNDCTANENTYFKTLNYTTYAGMFIMHPLCHSESVFQICDAIADNKQSVGHINAIKDKIDSLSQSKYSYDSDLVTNTKYKPYKAIIVLSGSNKIYEHTSAKKLKKLCREYGSELLIKPHPITTDKIIEDIVSVAIEGGAQVASRYDDLYMLMSNAEKVYTTHISETALTALIMGKEVEPMEPFGVRLTGSFSHINRVCFTSKNPIDLLGKAFASSKSGVIYPVVDKDWKEKMGAYFDYIMSQREIQKGHYIE